MGQEAIAVTWVREYFSYIVHNLSSKNTRGLFHRIIIGLFFDEQEILPWVQGDFRFDNMNNLIEKFPSPETNIRALVEGQFIAKRAHAEDLGFHIGERLLYVCLVKALFEFVLILFDHV